MFSDMLQNFGRQHVGDVLYFVIAFGLFFIGPVPALVLTKKSLDKEHHGPRDGLHIGLVLAVWTSLCWLFVPTCLILGPCLPGILFIEFAFMSLPVDTLPEEMAFHLVGFTLWPFLGWSIFHLDRSRNG